MKKQTILRLVKTSDSVAAQAAEHSPRNAPVVVMCMHLIQQVIIN